jgi:hypothetical protein
MDGLLEPDYSREMLLLFLHQINMIIPFFTIRCLLQNASSRPEIQHTLNVSKKQYIRFGKPLVNIPEI